MKSCLLVLSLLVSAVASGAALPGFGVELVDNAQGFVSSIAVDSHRGVYYTTTDGKIIKTGAGLVATVNTIASGNSGLIGMALLDDNTAVVHYTTPNQTYDVVSRIDLTTGAETEVHRFVCDVELPGRGTSGEHHGGNPAIGPNGSIFVGIGDYGTSGLARLQGWNAGRIFRIDAEGNATEYAGGYRNPFDLAWDEENQRLITSDNGPVAGDEIHIMTQGAHAGWPFTYGNNPPQYGSQIPDYVWPSTIAPTGMLLVRAPGRVVHGGLFVGSFVRKALYYFADVKTLPLAAPIAVIEGETGPVIDVAQSADGEIFFASGTAIYRLITPLRGDCNGDGLTDTGDLVALEREIEDKPSSTTDAQNGRFRSSWGCDVDEDGRIGSDDRAELVRMLTWKRRSVRSVRP